MGNPVTKWISDDGLSFDDERSMLLHELALVDAKEIDLFVKQYKERKQKEYAVVLLDWQRYQRSIQNIALAPKPVIDAKDLFSSIPQGKSNFKPEDYSLEDEDLAIEESFRRASPI